MGVSRAEERSLRTQAHGHHGDTDRVNGARKTPQSPYRALEKF
jgi:hypothetical protein